MERTDMEFKSIDATIEDIITEFSDLPIEQVREALRNGSLGEYGSTFRLSTQEICVWIRKYRFNKNSKRIS